MDRLVDLMLEVWDVPVFQFGFGLVLGLMTVGALWLARIWFEAGQKIEGMEEEDDGND